MPISLTQTPTNRIIPFCQHRRVVALKKTGRTPDGSSDPPSKKDGKEGEDGRMDPGSRNQPGCSQEPQEALQEPTGQQEWLRNR